MDTPPDVLQAAHEAWLHAPSGAYTDALAVAVGVAYQLGVDAGAGDMERLERDARADELEAWAAATLRRANQIRAGEDNTVEVEYAVQGPPDNQWISYVTDLQSARAVARRKADDGAAAYSRTITTTPWEQVPDES